MELCCEKCDTRYRINPALLIGGGRMVRCTKCFHTWFCPPEDPAGAHPATDDLPFETDEVATGQSFEEMLAQSAEAQNDVMPVARVPQMPSDMPVMDYRPGGMGPSAFGLSTFLLLLFATLSALFLLRDTVVRAYPPLLALYQPLGFQIAAPGEGLRFSELMARTSDAGEDKIKLDLSMKLANISTVPKAYPSLKVTIFGPYGAALKDWEFHPGEAELAAGDAIPVNLSFDNVPKDGKTVGVVVTGP